MTREKCGWEAFQERDLRVLVDIRLNMSQQCALEVKRANHILGHGITSQSGGRIMPLYSAWCGLTWSAVCISGSHNLRRKWKKSVSMRRHQNWWKGWQECPVRGVFRFGEKEAEGWPHHSLQLPEEVKWRGRCWSPLKYPETGHVERLKATSEEYNVILCCHSSVIPNWTSWPNLKAKMITWV